MRDQGEISDISEHGCRVTAPSLDLAVGTRIVVTPEGMEGIVGILRWRDRRVVGVEFERPIYGPIIAHLARLHPAIAAVTLD